MQRISLFDTSSFAELPAHWQNHLRWLHDDYFYHRHSDLWSAQALESLPALMNATDMLVCGEDLGMVPHCVHPVLHILGLLGEIFLQSHLPMPEESPSSDVWPYTGPCDLERYCNRLGARKYFRTGACMHEYMMS